MTFRIRRFWMEEIQRILQEKAKEASEMNMYGMGM